MKNFILRVYLHLKSIRLLAVIPPIMLNIAFPLLVYEAYKVYGLDSTYFYGAIVANAYIVFPLFSVWSVMFVIREYIESEGNELLYVVKSRSMLGVTGAIFFLFMFNALLWFVGFSCFVYSHLIYDYLMVACACVMYFGLTYFLVYLTNSLVLTLMIMLIYSLATLITSTNEVNFIFYVSYMLVNSELVKKICLPQLCVGAVLLTVGIVLNKKYCRFR